MTVGADDQDPSRQTVYDSPTDPISEAVVTAIATADECDQTAVQPPLYEVVDPDALDALYQRTAPHVTFEYAGYHVEIQPDQTIVVTLSVR